MLDLLDTWQAKVLRAAHGRCYLIMLSVLSHNFDDQPWWIPLLQLSHHGFRLRAPFICSTGRINKAGQVEARMFDTDERTYMTKEWITFYDSEIAFRDEIRRFADDLRLPDTDRVALFAAVANWLNRDDRLDPTMDPQDPDAKRLTVN